MRLRAEDVHFTYPGRGEPVLRGVDLDIPAGTSAAVIGPSGSGKTTLLALMGHLLPMQRGRIAAADATGAEHPLTSVATWVLQTVSLLPDRTALDNVAVGAYSQTSDRTEARRRAVACLAAVGLAGHEQDPARLLSGGEAQRVAIARALASRRPIILADEPTGQLDAASSSVVLDAMLAAQGSRTVVVVTHDPEVAARCDVVLRLRAGVIEVERCA